jgi:hypothetical protein
MSREQKSDASKDTDTRMRAVEAGSVPQAVVQMLVFIAVSRMSPLF